MTGEGAAADSATLVGQQIGGYLLKSVLGVGSFGTVFLGESHEDHRLVAVKLLHEHLAANPEIVRRFVGEARAATLIRHESVVEVLDVNVLEGTTRYYLVLEYLQGETLEERCKRGAVPLGEAVPLLRQLCDALSAAHVVGILHRDLKPENIFLAEREGRTVVKVMDFGVARRQHLSAGERRTVHGMVLGTPLYLSPEQAVGLEVDARTDVYSIGVIMFRMLTGRLPFTGDNAMDLIIAHRTKPPPKPSAILPELGPDVDDVVLKALAKQPAQRYPQMTDFEAAIASLAPPEVPVAATGPLEQALRWIEAIAEGKHYQLLQVDPGADAATIEAAVSRAVQWFDRVGGVSDPRQRHRVQKARARLAAAERTLLDLRERALYDAESGDFVGVARGFTRGLPAATIDELRVEFLRRRPHFDARSQPAAVAELVARRPPEEALTELARLLTQDPLNLELQRHYWGLRRRSAAPP